MRIAQFLSCSAIAIALIALSAFPSSAQGNKSVNETPVVVGPPPHGKPGTIREVETQEELVRRCDLKAETKYQSCVKQKRKECFKSLVQEVSGCCKEAGLTLPKGTSCTTYMKEKGILKSLTPK